MATTHTDALAEKSGSFSLGGDLPVYRLGFGTMQLTGKGVWGEPADRQEAMTVLDYCTRENIGFIPWFPLATGNLAKPGGPVARVAERLDAQPAQVALAWLLQKSPVMLPIPGTSKTSHLEENTAAAALQLDDSTMQELES